MTPIERILEKERHNNKVQEMLNVRFRRNGYVPEFVLRYYAEKLSGVEKYPQYRNHFDAWTMKAVDRAVRTKSGQAFKRGDITLTNGQGVYYSYRNGISTVIEWHDPIRSIL